MHGLINSLMQRVLQQSFTKLCHLENWVLVHSLQSFSDWIERTVITLPSKLAINLGVPALN